MKLRNVLVVVALTGVALAAAAQGIDMVDSVDQSTLMLALAAVALVLTIVRRSVGR